MILSKEQRQFLKRNKETLNELFGQRLKELKESSADLDANLMADEFKIKFLGYKNFINELENWLKTINILDKEKEKEEPDMGV